MLEYLFLVFIAPLQWIMQISLEWGYTHTHSYGIALLIMSVAVNILLIPLYHLAETWQQAERDIQLHISSNLKRINKAFTGRERYMMLRTLYRQNHYHPILAMRSTFGFLIQVPFFLAAYHFLSNYPPLNGSTFLGIANLGEPDGVLHISSFAINILPFIMTMLNLASAHVYTQNLTNRDRIQTYVIAGLFLVLLYNSASGLVLYWTFNNIFSLLKNVVYKQIHLKLPSITNHKPVMTHENKYYGIEFIFLYTTIFILAPCLLIYLERGYFLNTVETLTLLLGIFVYVLFYAAFFNKIQNKIITISKLIAGALALYVFFSVTIYPMKPGILTGNDVTFSYVDIGTHFLLLMVCFVAFYVLKKIYFRTFCFI